MPTTIIPFTPGATMFEPAEKRQSALTTRRKKRSRVSSLNEPEARLWKVCAQASRREAIIELLVLTVLILITLALLVDCFVELQQQSVGGSDRVRALCRRPPVAFVSSAQS
jgi:hypothetical protein